MKAKKVLSVCLSAALLLTVMGGCGNSKEEKKGSDSKDGASIVVWTQMETELKLLQEYGKKFEEETGTKVTVINQASDIQKYSQAVNSADGPDGMFGVPNDQLANYVSANLVQEIPQDLYAEEDFVDASVQASYVNGKKYAIPISVETPFLFYNTEKVEKMPETWEEMVEIGKETGGISYEASSVYYNLGFLRAYDSYIFKYADGAYDPADIGLGNEGAVKAYEFIQQMADAKFFSSDVTYDQAKSNFQNGDAAFYIGGAWDVDGFKEAGTKFGVSDMPTLNGKDFVTPVGTYVGFVSAKSDRQEETFAFYKYLVEHAAEDLYNTGNRIPASLKGQEAVGDSEVTKAQIAQIAKGEPLPTVSEMGLIWQPFEDNMKLMFTGSITPEQAADYIADQVQESIELMQSGQ